jgi:transcriptional regulator with XRE-family HTH domain
VLSSIHDSRYLILRQDLARVRKAAGLTQVEIANRLGVGQSYVSKLERGESYLDVLFLVDWCLACGASPAVVVQKIAELAPPRLNAFD